MRVLKLIFVILIIGGIFFLSVSCGRGNATPVSTLTTTVKRGNIVVSVTGTGNLALEVKQELSFGQTGIASQATTAKISEVDVVAGQTVKQGQVLVKADTTDWQNQLITDQHNLDSATAGVAQAQSGVAQAQANVAQAQANIDQAQQTLIQDQANLVKAQQNLSAQQDVQKIQNQIDNANIQLQLAQMMLRQALAMSDTANIQYWRSQIVYFSANTNPGSSNPPDGGEIGVLQKEMSDLLTDPAHAGVTLVSGGADSVAQIQQDVLAVQQAQSKIVTDQANLITLQANLVTSQANITNAQNNVVLAQNKMDDAQTTLNNDKNSAQEIDAPFNGLITQVNVSQGQIVQRNATLIEIADPNKFVANILVTEHDVVSVKIGDNATVSFNALQGLNYPAKITQIAPLATIQQGVVNYQVTVELTSLTPVFPSRSGQNSSQSANGTFPSNRTPGTSSAGTPAFGGAPASGTTTPPSNTPAPPAGRVPSTGTTQPITLKDGLSATVTIPIQEKDNVLILPSRVIVRQGQNNTVQVVKGTTTETVVVQTGITDGINTEIISGVNEGDQVLLQPRPTSTATPGGFQGGGGLRIP
jgi:multidrug resistance efflux pump